MIQDVRSVKRMYDPTRDRFLDKILEITGLIKIL